MSSEQYPLDERFLRQKLESDPSDWESRRQLAHVLYDKSEFHQAADIIWGADHIPSNDLDLAYAARVLAKAQPRKAIRLLAAVLELNQGKAVQNMGMANALLHHGMALQAARFYGAALEADPTLVNPDLEHFILWIDDEMSLWADFTNCRPKLGELPWMARDPMEALKLTSRVSLHTTPISIPNLSAVPGEDILNELYQQEMRKRGKITPPPAVTIPIDRVNPKDRRYDDKYGATAVGGDAHAPEETAAEAPNEDTAVARPAASGPATSPMPPRMTAVPMAIAVPDHVVPVIPSVTPTVSLTPPPPRSPASVSAPGVAQAPTPTRRLITPGVKPAPTGQFTAPAALAPPKAEAGN